MKVLVIGDSCKDVYVYGRCERLCPDAPVPVFLPSRREENQGMAGNVQRNLEALNIDCDIVTNQSEVTKTRYVEEKTNHMIVRIDSGEEKIKRIDNLHLVELEKYDAIVVSDYNKGFLAPSDIEYVSQNHSLVFLDTKKWLGEWAKDITFIKINEVEYAKTAHTIEGKDWTWNNLIITLGSRGCRYRDESYTVEKVEIKDLSGAGDSFLAGLVYGYLKDRDIGKSLDFANRCATQVVQQKGVTTINDV